MSTETILIACVTSIGTVLVTKTYDYFVQRRRAQADIAKVEAEGDSLALTMIKPLKQTIADLNDELEAVKENQRKGAKEREQLVVEMDARDKEHIRIQGLMQAEIDELRGGMGVLVAQLKQAGIKPNYEPSRGGPLHWGRRTGDNPPPEGKPK